MSTTTSSPSFAHLLPPSWKTQVAAWLAEDTPSFDYGGFVVGEAPRAAFLFGKGTQTAVLAGVPFFDEIFAQLGCQCVSLDTCGLTKLQRKSQSGMARRGGRDVRARQARRDGDGEGEAPPARRARRPSTSSRAAAGSPPSALGFSFLTDCMRLI